MFESFDELTDRIKATGYFIDPVMTRIVFLAAKLQKPLLLEGPAGSGKAEVVFWIEQGWLQASIACRGKRRSYIITPESLMSLYKQHHGDVLKRGIPNQALFEAYVQYCFSPKHTVGEQLLEVRRDKRERAAYAAVESKGPDPESDEEEGEEEEDADVEGSYRGDMEGSNRISEDSRIECE
jgi:hypothetical protein